MPVNTNSQRRGDTMNTTAVSMPSVTLAIKAKRMFNEQGFTCTVKRAANVSENGCTHMIVVNGAPEIVIAFLDKYNIYERRMVLCTDMDVQAMVMVITIVDTG